MSSIELVSANECYTYVMLEALYFYVLDILNKGSKWYYSDSIMCHNSHRVWYLVERVDEGSNNMEFVEMITFSN